MKIKSNKYDYEIAAWLRVLHYLQQENVYIKNYIAEIIKKKMQPEILEQVEYYQNMVLNQETVIAFLRTDIRKLKQEYGSTDFLKKHKTLKSDMQNMEKEHTNLRAAFIAYVYEIISS